MINRVITKLCETVASRLEKKTIYRDDGIPYLERYYIFHSDQFKFLPGVYLHKFLSSDEDVELHDHPWRLSGSLILTGGYLEQRRYNKGDNQLVLTHLLSPGSINIIKGSTFHRVDLIEDFAWTLFVSGNKVRDWGFWHPKTKKYTPWKEFVEKKRHQQLDAAAE
jgi:hypothetical protein